MTTKLNQIVALEKGLKARTTDGVTQIHRILGKPALFAGLNRVYQPKDENGEQLPPERQTVQHKVSRELGEASALLSKLFDVVATKEWGNASGAARADVVVDGTVVIADVPVPYLLFLEKELVNWRTLVTKVPLLDPAEVWTYDENAQLNRTEPTQTVRSKKVPTVLVKYPATDKHPAQTETYNDDVPVGTWSLTRLSGAVPVRFRDAMVERANKLIDAVKVAREQANGAEIEQKYVAAGVFTYLLGGTE